MNSSPKVMPPRVSGIIPWYRWRSEPQMAAIVTRTIASFGCSIFGGAFSSTRTLYGPRYTMARILNLVRSQFDPARLMAERGWPVPRVERRHTIDAGARDAATPAGTPARTTAGPAR